MNSIVTLSTRAWRHLMHDSLRRNSLYLMVSTAVMAGFGFLFWIIGAKLYSPEQVGIATTLISAITLIGSFAILGYDTSIIRYLSVAPNRASLVSSVTIFTGVAGLLLAVVYVLLTPLIADELSFLQNDFLTALIFVILVPLFTANVLLDSVFTALKIAHYALVKSIVLSGVKLLALLVVVHLGVTGVITSYLAGYLLAIVVSVYLLLKMSQNKKRLLISIGPIKSTLKFAASNHLGSFIATIPMLTLPILILRFLGSSSSAYFYICAAVATLVFTVPFVVADMVVAEGSSGKVKDAELIKRSLHTISLILLPLIIGILFLAPIILNIFGPEYSKNGTDLLRLLVLSAIPMAVSYVLSALLNLKFWLKEFIFVNILATCILLVFSIYILIAGYGLLHIGIIWLLGQCLAALLFIATWMYKSNKTKRHIHINA